MFPPTQGAQVPTSARILSAATAANLFFSTFVVAGTDSPQWICAALVAAMSSELNKASIDSDPRVLSDGNRALVDLKEKLFSETPAVRELLGRVTEQSLGSASVFENIPVSEIRKLVSEVTLLGGKVFLLPDTEPIAFCVDRAPSRPYFSVDEQGEGFIGLPTHAARKAVEHELTHLKHWTQFKRALIESGLTEKDAGLRASAAVLTPIGIYSMEARAVSKEMDWSLANEPIELSDNPTLEDFRTEFYRHTYAGRSALLSIDYLKAVVSVRAHNGQFRRHTQDVPPLDVDALPLMRILEFQEHEIMDHLISSHIEHRKFVARNLRELSAQIQTGEGTLKTHYEDLAAKLEEKPIYEHFLSLDDPNQRYYGTSSIRELFDARMGARFRR